ncbi:MAG TPA: hypothetical protein VFT87_00765, partial [Candidatus Saccharimonadales bacterium]|nr:hypothetical protein [Candidatus Saccharimonadales bacterium]
SQAFSISPPLIELQSNPGQTIKASIRLTNLSDSALVIKSQFNDFGAKDETGEPNIIFDEQETTTYSLRHWIVAPAPFTVAPKESKTIDFPITVPNNAEPGGHYAVIRFTGSPPELDQSGVTLAASIGSLVLLNVSGEVNEKSDVAEFFAATPKFAKNGLFEAGPITLVERIKNDGNVHIKPTGSVEIFNMFGQKVASLRANGAPGDAQNPPKSILPNSVRRFDQTWDSGFAFGRYRARMEMTYGQNNKPLFATLTFWVIPYKLIGSVLVATVVLFFLMRLAIKKYNAHIIRKADGQNKDLRLK